MTKINIFLRYCCFFAFIIFCGLSCSLLKGKYCHSNGSYECIEFKKSHKFNYDYRIDTGSDKGCGTYEVKSKS